MSNLHIRLNETDEKNLQFLKDNGYTNVSSLIKDLIEQKIKDAIEGIECDKESNSITMDKISVREKEIVVFGKVTAATREGMFRLIDEKRIDILPDHQGFVIRY